MLRSVQALRSNRLISALIVAVTFFGWMVLANHCALGGLAQPQVAEEDHSCCQRSEPASTQDAPAEVQCCKSLHAVAPEALKTAAPVLMVWVLEWAAELLPAETPAISPSGSFGDGSPPPAVPFSELVLQRSLLSHAPPVAA